MPCFKPGTYTSAPLRLSHHRSGSSRGEASWNKPFWEGGTGIYTIFVKMLRLNQVLNAFYIFSSVSHKQQILSKKVRNLWGCFDSFLGVLQPLDLTTLNCDLWF